MPTRSGPGPAVVLQFLALAAAWGASFLFIKIGLEGLAPTQVVLGRLLCGAAALAVICLVTRHHLPTEPATWGHLAVVAALLCVVPFLLFAWAELHISSGLASIYNATTPLMTMLVAMVALRAERPTRHAVAGLAVGFLGVLLVLGPWRGLGGGEATAQAACLLATASYGLAFVYLRRYISPLRLHAIPVATVQVGLATALLGIAAPWVATQPVTLTPRVIGSVAALGIVGTGLAYVWNTNVVAGWGATNASTVTYLTPVVGVILGVAILGEGLTWNQPAGAVVVVIGIAVGQARLTPWIRRRQPARLSP